MQIIHVMTARQVNGDGCHDRNLVISEKRSGDSLPTWSLKGWTQTGSSNKQPNKQTNQQSNKQTKKTIGTPGV